MKTVTNSRFAKPIAKPRQRSRAAILPITLALTLAGSQAAIAARSFSEPDVPSRDRREEANTCPQEIGELGAAMLEDLPGYYNRATIRSRPNSRDRPRSRMLIAGELELLTPEELEEFGNETVTGFFFSTLERTYINDESETRQGFHQIFLTRDAAGWIVLTTRSSWGGYPDPEPVTPPVNSSSGTLAQSARTWIRDCQAG